MRRKKNNLRKEKIIMISASAFVLTALTMAGVYVREQSKENDEYRVDLSELDNQSVADKTSEIAENLGVSQVQVSRNEKKVLIKLKNKLSPDYESNKLAA